MFMIIPKKILFISFFLLFVTQHCAGTQETGNKGTGWTKAKGFGSSEREAVESAKVQAIKNVIGEQIKGGSSVVDGQLQNSSASSFFKGFASQVKVLNKSQKNGSVDVEIECFVDSKEIVSYIENVLNSKNKPRFMIIVSENNLGTSITPDMGQQTSTETALISSLNDLGFDFVQNNEVLISLLKSQKGNLSLAIQGNAKAAKKLGTEMGAEFVIIANSSMEEKNSAGGGRVTVHAIANLKIVDVGTGSIVASQETYGGDASTNPKIASLNSIKYAIDEALNGTTDRIGMLRQMLKKWNPGNGNEIQIGLEVSNFIDLSDFITLLEKVDDRIVSVDSKGYKIGNSLVQVFFRGSSTDLLKLITKNKNFTDRFKTIIVKQQAASQIFLIIE